MKAGTALLLARPSAPAERGRFLLVAGSTAVAGGLLLAGARIARLGVDSRGGNVNAQAAPIRPDAGLAEYVADPGLRFGVVVGAGLLLVPLLALAVQALRVGSLARERRMASIRLAGATPRDVRWVAGLEAGLAAAVGGLLAGPVYLLHWVLLGPALPAGLRLVPTPTAVDLLVWLMVVVATAVGGALAGAVVQGRVVVEPLGVRRRIGTAALGRANLASLVVGTLLVLLGWAGLVRARGGEEIVVFFSILLGLLLVAFSGGPRLVRRRGRRLTGRGSAVDLLAGARLAADPKAPGRVAAVLLVCGLVLGLGSALVVDLLSNADQYSDLGFYLVGFAMAFMGVAVAVIVAVLTLLVGAADQLLDARRPLASLAALGVGHPVLEQVLRRQQSAAAVPAVVLGVMVGGAVGDLMVSAVALVAVTTLVLAALSGLLVALVTRFAAALLRSRLRAAIDPENLRVA